MKVHDWNKIAQKQKKELSNARPIFVVGPRELSEQRLKLLVKKLQTQRAVVWGCLKDDYINGFEGCAQFRTLDLAKLEAEVKTSDRMSIITYFQRDLCYILKELDFSAVILINGSWKLMLHTTPEFWTILKRKIPYKLISPFVDEAEARRYAQKIAENYSREHLYDAKQKYTDEELMHLVEQVAKRSFDWTYQIGAALVKSGRVISTAHNSTLPFETASMHYGHSKELNFSPLGDQNYYDTNHAEVELVLKALQTKTSLDGCSLYLNVMPCPTCARMLAHTDLEEVVYTHDHSDGYAARLLTNVGKKVRRVLT